MITRAQLAAIAPGAGTLIDKFLGPLNAAMAEFGIDTPARQAAFLATVAHESGQFSKLEENLSYSADRLMAVWPKRFPTLDSALAYARTPERLANHVYAHRGGNGDEASGDGWRFRGAGLTGLTFRDNHTACAAHFGIPLGGLGAWLRTPEGGARSAAWFWSQRGVNRWADAGDFDGVCDAVNLGHKTPTIGDAIGYGLRLAAFKVAVRVLA